jgi:hypothetical protein
MQKRWPFVERLSVLSGAFSNWEKLKKGWYFSLLLSGDTLDKLGRVINFYIKMMSIMNGFFELVHGRRCEYDNCINQKNKQTILVKTLLG